MYMNINRETRQFDKRTNKTNLCMFDDKHGQRLSRIVTDRRFCDLPYTRFNGSKKKKKKREKEKKRKQNQNKRIIPLVSFFSSLEKLLELFGAVSCV